MHILYPCNEYPPAPCGGIGPAVATLARGMARAGHQVTAIGMYPQAAPVTMEDGVEIHRLQMPCRHRWIRWWVARRALRAAILGIHRRKPIDLIEWPDYQGWYWKPIAGVVDVVKVHGTMMSHRLHGLYRRQRIIEHCELHTLRNIRNWIGVSDWFKDEWKRIANVIPEHETVVYNPVDTGLFQPTTNGKERGLVLYAGGLKRRKGVQVLARAARIFLQEAPNSRLMMIGFPADLTENDVRTEAGPVADRIEFVPFVRQDELARHFARAAVYAMPSLYESCGNTWVEAASSGLPVVGSTESCGPEIVLDGQTGFLTDPSDPRDVADKVLRLLRDENLARQFGEAGRERAKQLFSIEVAVQRSESFYTECLRDGERRQASASRRTT